MDQNALFTAIKANALPSEIPPALLDLPKESGAFEEMTPLEVALLLGRPALAEALVARGAGIEARDAVGYTPLIYFAGRKEPAALDAIDWLLARGADPHAATAKGTTVLHRAATDAGLFPAHFVAVAEKLLAAGASHAARNKTGFTPILHAVYSHGADLIRVLVRAGADIHATTTDGATALHLVPISYLSWRKLDDAQPPAQRQAAEITAESLATLMITTLLELGARPDTKTSSGSTAFELARAMEMPQAVAALLRPPRR